MDWNPIWNHMSRWNKLCKLILSLLAWFQFSQFLVVKINFILVSIQWFKDPIIQRKQRLINFLVMFIIKWRNVINTIVVVCSILMPPSIMSTKEIASSTRNSIDSMVLTPTTSKKIWNVVPQFDYLYVNYIFLVLPFNQKINVFYFWNLVYLHISSIQKSRVSKTFA